MKHLPAILFWLCTIPFMNLQALETSQQQDSVHVLRGRVLGGDTNQPLINASITVQRANVSSITNQDGYFSIRVPASTRNSNLLRSEEHTSELQSRPHLVC